MGKNKIDGQRVVTVGWREWLALPQLGIPAIKAKVDTGARTSALHAHSLELFSERGAPHVRFVIRPLRRRPRLEITCEAAVIDRRIVSDSGGHKEKRYVIETLVQAGDAKWPIEVTLTNRDTMLFRMLLGRRAMEGRLIVDPNASYLLGRALSKAYTRKRK